MNWTNTEKKIQLMELCQRFIDDQVLTKPEDVFNLYTRDKNEFIQKIGNIVGWNDDDL